MPRYEKGTDVRQQMALRSSGQILITPACTQCIEAAINQSALGKSKRLRGKWFVGKINCRHPQDPLAAG